MQAAETANMNSCYGDCGPAFGGDPASGQPVPLGLALLFRLASAAGFGVESSQASAADKVRSADY